MKPLEAVSVLDLTEGNPYIGSEFADYGATVLKVEKPSAPLITQQQTVRRS